MQTSVAERKKIDINFNLVSKMHFKELTSCLRISSLKINRRKNELVARRTAVSDDSVHILKPI